MNTQAPALDRDPHTDRSRRSGIPSWLAPAIITVSMTIAVAAHAMLWELDKRQSIVETQAQAMREAYASERTEYRKSIDELRATISVLRDKVADLSSTNRLILVELQRLHGRPSP